MNALSRIGGAVAHFALYPLGKSNNLLIRIANFALQLFAVATPVFLAYRAFSGQKILTTLKPMAPIPPAGEAAIAFAKQQLAANPNVKATKFLAPWTGAQTLQPVSVEIAQLNALYAEIEKEALALWRDSQPETRMNNPQLVEAVDKWIKLAYTLSVWTLQDLDAYVQQNPTWKEYQQDVPRTKAKALTLQDSYMYRTYYYATRVYHYLRSNGNQDSPAHSALFYTKGTKQNEWNQLYNDFCDRVRMHVTEADLQRADNRHYTWTKKDTGVASFHHEPDTLPT